MRLGTSGCELEPAVCPQDGSMTTTTRRTPATRTIRAIWTGRANAGAGAGRAPLAIAHSVEREALVAGVGDRLRLLDVGREAADVGHEDARLAGDVRADIPRVAALRGEHRADGDGL